MAIDNITKTEQERVQQALRDSEARLAGIIASAMDAIITIDDQQNILLFNNSAEAMFGYPANTMIGQPLGILLPARFRALHRQHVFQFGETGTTNRSMGKLGTLFGLRKNGEEFPIEASISQVEAEQGRLYTVILRDITERVKVEETLAENEQNLRATFEQAAVGIGHLDPEGRWLRVNRRLCEITGYSEAEMKAMSFREITPANDVAMDEEMHGRLLRGEMTTYNREKRYIRKDGSLIWVNMTASLVRDMAGKPKYLVKFIEDITKRKAAETALQAKADEIKGMTQQLWQSAKLATMGELAASIAHELNNPLAILSLRIESLLSSAEPGSQAVRELEVMGQEVDRMASLVTNLLQFSRSTERQISSIDVREEVDRTLELIHTYMVHRHIQVQRSYAPSLPLLHADRQQLRQLFLNLFTNAIDAMPQGGELQIRIQPVGSQPGIRIEVQDTGIGIKTENLRQVMEPFFTTKEEGKGTGLGLAICRRIVEEHNGTIRISSEGENQGTLVQITFPAANETRQSLLEE